jgi:hypothetical protein
MFTVDGAPEFGDCAKAGAPPMKAMTAKMADASPALPGCGVVWVMIYLIPCV